MNSASEWRERLQQLRDGLQSVADSARQGSDTVELDQSGVGRLSRMDALQMQAMSQASERRQAIMLRQIEAALRRLDKGVFGICQECDEPIASGRLQADPTTLFCIDCATARETD